MLDCLGVLRFARLKRFDFVASRTLDDFFGRCRPLSKFPLSRIVAKKLGLKTSPNILKIVDNILI